jgi:simple sugar transport system permease protein
MSDQIQEAKSNQSKSKQGNILLKYGTIIMVVVLALIFQGISPMFLSMGNIMNILRSASILLVLTLALSVVVSTSEFDLSFGMVASLASIVSAALMVWYGTPIWVAVSVPLVIGLLIGWINGVLIEYLGIKDILATLGVSFVVQGIHLTIGQGNSIHNMMMNPWTKEKALGAIPDAFRFMATGYIGPIPTLVIIAFSIAVLVHLFLYKSRWGRYIYVIGGNREAGFLAGIKVKQVQILAFMICGMLAAFAGILLTARIGSGQLYCGENYFMEALLATFLSFTVFGAGKANVPGAIVGAIFATIISNGLTMAGIHPYSVDIYKGFALVFAVGFQSYQVMRAKKQ